MPDPRRHFILDLQSWLEFLISEDHHLIVTMDANSVDDPDKEYASHPLPYAKDKLTTSATHDGKLSTLVASCDLCLPSASQHPTCPFPTSHISGRNQIDYIFISKAILPAVQRSGVLSHHSLTTGDHRPYYLDFDASILFSDPAFIIEPASMRKLRLQDPRVVKQYISTLYDQLSAHNIFPRLEKLQEQITNKAWTDDSTTEYDALDKGP